MRSTYARTEHISNRYNRSALVAGTVFLEAGPDRRRYDVHKALLVHHSGYFRNALKGPWKEAEEGVLTLEDVEPLAGMSCLLMARNGYCQELLSNFHQ